jgi:hypothetical protein
LGSALSRRRRYDPNAVAVLHLTSLRKVGHVQRIDALAIARVADDRQMAIKMVAQVLPPPPSRRPHSAHQHRRRWPRARHLPKLSRWRWPRPSSADSPALFTRARPEFTWQVESGAAQMYKFPLRISFFGRTSDAPRVAAHLAAGGVALTQPKPRVGRGRGRGAHAVSAASARGGGERSTGGRGGRGSAGVASRQHADAAVHEAAATADRDGSDDDEVEVTQEKNRAEWYKDKELLAQAIVLD